MEAAVYSRTVNSQISDQFCRPKISSVASLLLIAFSDTLIGQTLAVKVDHAEVKLFQMPELQRQPQASFMFASPF